MRDCDLSPPDANRIYCEICGAFEEVRPRYFYIEKEKDYEKIYLCRECCEEFLEAVEAKNNDAT